MGVDECVLIKDGKRSFCSNEDINARITPNLSPIINCEIQRRTKEASVNCSIVRGKKLSNFPIKTKVTIERDKENT